MDDSAFVIAMTSIVSIFVGLPWLVFHYVTKWKQGPKITVEDERMLDEMYNLARRLEDRVNTVERIVAADHPEWRPGLQSPDWQPGIAAPTYSPERRN